MNKFHESPILIESPLEPSKIISITCHVFMDESYKVYEYFRIRDLSDITGIDYYCFTAYQDKVHTDFIEPVNIIKCFYLSNFLVIEPPYKENNEFATKSLQFKDFALKLLEASVNTHWYYQSMAYQTYIHDLALADDKKSFDDCFN